MFWHTDFENSGFCSTNDGSWYSGLTDFGALRMIVKGSLVVGVRRRAHSAVLEDVVEQTSLTPPPSWDRVAVFRQGWRIQSLQSKGLGPRYLELSCD